jgi:hypothetical protein
MNKRNPLPLWIVVSIFLAAVTAVPLICQLRSRSATPPPTATQLRTLTELEEVLSQDAPELRVVLSSKYRSLEKGMYFCKDSRSWEQLSWIPHDYKNADKWQGIVYCERVGNFSSIPEWEIQLWGEHTMRIEPFLFFGDPALLRRIDQIIRNHANREQRMGKSS